MSLPDIAKVARGEKAVVLLSGGLDSATLLAYAHAAGYELYCLSFDYGQHAIAEIEGAKKLVSAYEVKRHEVVSIGLNQFGGTALVGDRDVPEAGKAQTSHGIPETYVPARNTVFLSLGLGWAETLGAYTVFIGANAVDYSGYPDCRPKYIQSFNELAKQAVAEGSAGGRPIEVKTPLMDLTKAEIIQLGLSLNLDYGLTVSCYDSTPDGRACGVCDSCALRLQGFREVGVSDPAPYLPRQEADDLETLAILRRAQVARRIAVKAGKTLMPYFGHLDGYENKGVVDLVSCADEAAEDVVLKGIRSAFPEDAILSEEDGGSEGSTGYRWIVDPLDGTTNFVHSQPQFAVSIALESEGRRIVGVIYLPYYDELYHAVRGEGAYGPDGPISVTKTADLNRSLVATGFPYSRRERIDKILEDVRRGVLNAQGIRRTGAAAVDLAYLAAGRYDGFWERELKPWDMAAGEVLVEEAGGVLSDFSGEVFSPHRGEIVGSNGHIHRQLLEALFGDRPQ